MCSSPASGLSLNVWAYRKMVFHIAEPYIHREMHKHKFFCMDFFCVSDFYRQLQFFLATSHFSLSEVSNNLTYVKLCSVCRRIANKVQSRKCVEDISTIRVYRKTLKVIRLWLKSCFFFFLFVTL